MPRIPGINHQAAIRAFERIGYRVIRQGKHVVMSNGSKILVIPRHNPINAVTMGIMRAMRAWTSRRSGDCSDRRESLFGYR